MITKPIIRIIVRRKASSQAKSMVNDKLLGLQKSRDNVLPERNELDESL
jgi:hypothetical protein